MLKLSTKEMINIIGGDSSGTPADNGGLGPDGNYHANPLPNNGTTSLPPPPVNGDYSQWCDDVNAQLTGDINIDWEATAEWFKSLSTDEQQIYRDNLERLQWAGDQEKAAWDRLDKMFAEMDAWGNC